MLDKELEQSRKLTDDEIKTLLEQYGTVEDNEGKLTLKPNNTSYDEIKNSETSLGSSSEDSSGSDSSGDNIEISKETFEQMQKSLTNLQKQVQEMDNNYSLRIDTLSQSIPIIQPISITKDITINSGFKTSDLSVTLPACYYCLEFLGWSSSGQILNGVFAVQDSEWVGASDRFGTVSSCTVSGDQNRERTFYLGYEGVVDNGTASGRIYGFYIKK